MAYYIYKIIDPRDNKPFYVGQTSNPEERFRSHFSTQATAVGKRMREIRQTELMPEFVLVEKMTINHNITARERYWIEKLIADGFELINCITWGENGRKKRYKVTYECEK